MEEMEGECEDSKLQAMQADFNKCAVELGYKFETERKEKDEEEALCGLITKTVDHCGDMWETCHMEEEVRRLKDTQLEALMGQYSEVGQKDCPAVEEYLTSGRQESNRKGMRCSDGQSLAAQKKFGGCSHRLVDQVYTSLGEEEYDEEQDEVGEEETEQEREEKREEVAGILCDTLGNIGKTCMKELQTCFRREDVVRTTTNHLESMKGFLINIAENKVVPGALDLCDPVTGIDFGPEEEEEEDYMYQEDYESEEVTSDAKEEIRAAIMEKLSEVKKEQQQDQPKDDAEVTAAQKKPNPKLGSSAEVSISASEKVSSVSTLLLVLVAAKFYV